MRRRFLVVSAILFLFAYAAFGCTDSTSTGLPDGDTVDGDTISDGDTDVDGDVEPDSDASPDGDKPADGDVLIDGDESPDGDGTLDGDVTLDGDDIADGDQSPDGDEILDGDESPDGDVIPDGDEGPDGDDILDGDESPDGDVLPDGDEETETEPTERRLVIAGDSWSVGCVPAMISALADWEFDDITVTYENTAVGGSRAKQWATNENGLNDKLMAALDAEPPAEFLVLVIGGNDLISDVHDGWGDWLEFFQNIALDNIRDDVQTIVDDALDGRPQLDVIIIGYDFLHYDFMETYFDLGDMNQQSFNEAFVKLGKRKLAIAQNTAHTYYAHNYGLMQYVYGDTVHLPFTNPPIAYNPGLVPKPGIYPTYQPFPGGLVQLPGPLDHLPDGLHLDGPGYRELVEYSFEQGMARLLSEDVWQPVP